MDQLMDEEIELNFEIIDTLKVLVEHTQWDSNNLKMKLEELIRQHNRIDSELYEIEFYEKPSKEAKA